MARLFFALWPGEAARGALAALARETARDCGGRAVAGNRLHLTLAFLGEVPAGRVGAVRGAAAAVSAAAFDLVLDRAGSFARAGVAWAGVEPPPPALATLQADLAGRLAAAGFLLERRPFAAHLTLARRVARPVEGRAIAPVGWRVWDFALVETKPGDGRYETIERWPLAGA